MRRATATKAVQREIRTHVAGVMAAAFVAVAPHPLLTQQTASLPFAAGERLNYRVRVGIMGTVGHGSMWIEGPVTVRGTPTLLLRSDFRARVAWFKAFDRSDSWLDAERMSVLRFVKSEKQPQSSTEERVEVFPADQRWENAKGETGSSPTNASLDELSFIYYIRTLPLEDDTVYNLSRHFDSARNPVTVRVLRRERIKTEAGEFRTIVVEMRVTDPRRYRNQGVIKLFLSDDHCRLPVRIESAAPMFGTAVFTVESITRGQAAVLAAAGDH